MVTAVSLAQVWEGRTGGLKIASCMAHIAPGRKF